MKRDPNVEIERGDEARTAGAEPFLPVLRKRMERTLMKDAEEPRKVGVADYLKLATLLEMARRASDDDFKEVVVRWEDPSEEMKDAG